MIHPSHPFHTGKDVCDSAVVVANSSSRNICDACGDEITSNKPRFQCSPCDFKLCHKCTKGYQHPAHVEHVLFLTVDQKKRTWQCGACRKSKSQIGDVDCYHCGNCNFNLCKYCFVALESPLHKHRLNYTDVRYTYVDSGGEWCCDCCGENNGHQNYFPRHCSSCQFDLCKNCSRPWSTSLHPHQLFKADSLLVYKEFSGGWACDNCRDSFRSHFNKYPYHCSSCKYDLCERCMKSGANRGIDISRPSITRGISDISISRPSTTRGMSAFRTKTTAGNPVTSPEEDLENVNASSVPPPEDFSSCVICLSNPKDATLVHGATGHVCCCMKCAGELKKRGAPCPICRATIDLVIQQFVS